MTIITITVSTHMATNAHHGDHQDLNLRSAYLHVVADAVTSVLAIIALFGGWLYGWSWLDPTMGIVGAVLIAVWAKNLLGETGKVLLDREMDHPVVEEIRQAGCGDRTGCRGALDCRPSRLAWSARGPMPALPAS